MTQTEIARRDNRHAIFTGIFTGYTIACIVSIFGDIFKIHFTTPEGARYFLFTLAVPLLVMLLFTMLILLIFDSYLDRGANYPIVISRSVYTKDFCKTYRQFVFCGSFLFVFYYLVSFVWVNREEHIGWNWIVSTTAPFFALAFFEFKRIKYWHELNLARSKI